MTNFEKYIEFFMEENRYYSWGFGVDKDGTPKRCEDLFCANCAFGGEGKTCKDFRKEWLTKDVEAKPTMTAEKAWEITRKIGMYESSGGYGLDTLGEIFGTANCPEIIEKNTVWEAKAKIEAWEERERLKPCPFCGAKTSVEIEIDDEDDYATNYAVNCDYSKGGCGATSGYRQTKAEAIELWNKRSVK